MADNTTTTYQPITYITNGTDTKEIQSVGILIGDDSATNDRLGSTSVVSTRKNVNLEAEKNIQFKPKKGKIVLDTTAAATANNGNETQIIAKIKEDCRATSGGTYFMSEHNNYGGDHGSVVVEVNKLRIKPFNTPEWGNTTQPSTTIGASTFNGMSKKEGCIYLDTAGLESENDAGTLATSADNEAKMQLIVGNNTIENNSAKITTGKYRPLQIKARNIDLRCMEHGGIALQPCGVDAPKSATHFENKIKFESSRIADIYADDINSSNQITKLDNYLTANTKHTTFGDGTATLNNKEWVKGGDGIEFGTFNNLHSSLFTRDYRFNKEGIVYAVNRDMVYEDADGKKYSKVGNTFYKYTNNGAGVPQTTTAETTAPVIAKADYVTQADDFKDIIPTSATNPSDITTVKDIVKTANALNSGRNRHTKITNSGNLEMVMVNTYHWVVDSTATLEDTTPIVPTYCSDLTAIYNEDDFDSTNVIPTTGNLYKTNNVGYKWTKIDSGSIKMKSDNAFDLIADADVTIESKSDDVVIEANDAIKLKGTEIRITATADSNNNGGIVSFDTTPTIVFLDKKFKKSAKLETAGTKFKTGILNNTPKTVFVTTAGIWKYPIDNLVLYTDATCTTPYTPTTTSAKTEVWYKDSNNTPTQFNSSTPEHLFINVNNSLWHLEVSDNVKVKKNPSIVATYADGTYTTTSTDYTDVQFVEYNYTAGANETSVAPETIGLTSQSCDVADIVTLVNWFKTNNLGPWNENTTTGGIVNA